MAYIGKTPVLGNFVKLDAISVVNGQAAYTMQNGGVNFTSYDNVNQFLVSLNGILQSPTDSFTVSGSTLTFASNLSTGDVIDFVMVLGNTLEIGTPSDNTVSLAKLTATGTKDATTFLRGDNTFDTPPLGGITQADMWRITTNVFKTSSAFITANWEQVDTDNPGFIGSSMTESSGVFTFPSTGIYLILANMYIVPDGIRTYSGSAIAVTTNNSSYSRACETLQHVTAGGNYINASSHFILDVTDTSNVKVKFEYVSAGSANIYGDTGQTNTGMSFIRLGDT